MNSTDLRFFLAVADAGAIGRAAAALHTVQSNVTARILSLERSLGVPLFYRNSRGVCLSSTGERLLPYARQISRLLEDAKHSVMADGRPRGPLRIGSMETMAALRLPPVLAGYTREFPDVELDLEMGPTAHLVERVLAREIDGAFVSGPIAHDDLSAQEIIAEELVIVSPSEITDYGQLCAFLADGKDVRALVFRAGCSYRARLETHLQDEGYVNIRKMEFGTLDGIVGCVEAGLGISLLPRVVANEAASTGRIALHALPRRIGIAPILLIRRTDMLATAAFSEFAAYAKSKFEILPQAA